MEQRRINVIFGKSGSGSVSTKLAIPKSWVDKMGVTQEERGVVVEFDDADGTIVIRKE
ncbi:MAG: hypothetical protein ACI4TK_00615 [Agathobacter sp.]